MYYIHQCPDTKQVFLCEEGKDNNIAVIVDEGRWAQFIARIVLAEDDQLKDILLNLMEITTCPTCGSSGFEKSVLGSHRCEFCDGTEGGNPPKGVWQADRS